MSPKAIVLEPQSHKRVFWDFKPEFAAEIKAAKQAKKAI